MYAVPAVILFCAKHHEGMLGNPPRIISRAFRQAERSGCGLAFPGNAVYQIFPESNLANWFAGEALGDMDMLTVGMEALQSGNSGLPIEVILLALFGVNVPDEVAQVCLDGRLGDLARTIAKDLKSKGIDWEEGWLSFTVATTPGPVAK